MEKPQPSMAPPHGPLWMWVGGQALRPEEYRREWGSQAGLGTTLQGLAGWGRQKGASSVSSPLSRGLALTPSHQACEQRGWARVQEEVTQVSLGDVQSHPKPPWPCPHFHQADIVRID